MIHTGILCKRLDWDSEFFGVAVARALPTRVSAETCGAILDWCRAESIDCLYLLADEERDSMRVLEDAAFVRVDERVTLELHPVPAVTALPVESRAALDSDVPTLREIAASAHHDSRFYHDGHFDRQRCDELYRVWIEKSCRGWADYVVVVERDSRAVGYLTVHIHDGDSASVGLVGVDPAYRRQGIGAHLMDGALAWIASRSIARVWTATQGRNAAAQAFFQGAGFRPTNRSVWYHRWFSAQSAVKS